MSDTQPTTADPAADSAFMRAMLKNRPFVRYAMFALAVAFLGFAVYQLIRFGVTIRPRWVYAAAMGVVCLVIALIDTIVQDEDADTQLRIELMLLGGMLGLGTALFGVAQCFFTYSEQIAGGLEKWREDWAALLNPLLAFVGGLALMFLSVQLVRGMERRNQALRRVIYGYNVVLTTLLLIAVLALPNILAYAEPFGSYAGRPHDWTQSNINAISDPLRNLLVDLRQPVKAYLLMERNTFVAQDTITLVENCRGMTPKFTWELIDPTRLDNDKKVRELMQKYNIGDPNGLLVVMESESDAKDKPQQFMFLKDTDLSDDMRGGRGAARTYSFLGENALLKTLQWLTEGKLVIYFTQGHGELRLEGGPPMGRGAKGEAKSVSTLLSRLKGRKGVEVKPLKIDATTKAVPDDASVVVIARPTQEFSKPEVDVLRAYVKRQAVVRKAKDANDRDEETVTAGKLFLLLDPVMTRVNDNTTFTRLGLEGFLAESGVRLGMNRILSPQIRPPWGLVCWAADNSTNPVAKAFAPDSQLVNQFEFLDVRTVDPLEEKGGPARSVQKLFETRPRVLVFAETDPNRDPEAAVNAILRDEALQEKQLSKDPLCIAVAVSDAGATPGLPRDAAHAGLQKDTPRMVVFGTAGWLADDMMNGPGGRVRSDLFNSCVSWLREKSSVGVTIEGKSRKEYDSNLKAPDAGRLLYFPLALLLMSVVGLGLGVWVVRRR